LKINTKGEYEIFPFWSLYTIKETSKKITSKKSDEDLLQELHDLLNDAVQRRMVSDVPIGSLLSGGIDSSLITALMIRNSNQQINTFSIGFNESKYNEAPYAKEVAKHLGTNHHELYVNSNDALNLVEKLPQWYDEPFADHSQIPTLMLCAMAKKHATVVLSGDGGDELFAGYTRYRDTLKQWQRICLFPYSIRLRIAKAIQTISANTINHFSPKITRRLHHISQILSMEKLDDLYRSKCSVWESPETILINAQETKNMWEDNIIQKSTSNILERIMLIDIHSYLPDDILTKVDRASMSVALEVRVPIIDHRVVELASQLPIHMKLRNQRTKWALRQILYQYVPQHLIERRKKGFGMPLDPWLRGPLRDWAENLLGENRLKSQELFEHKPVRDCWNKFLSGTSCGNLIWIVLMTQAWIDANPDVSL
ncbi:MAG: asparagine synthase C-terminal domain-containing protein, partial [Gammaproteobacteria bacterium]